MMTIHLYDLKFYSYHGIHEEERILGGEYEVNAEVKFHESEFIESLSQTADYEEIFNIIKQRMSIATPLLETVVMDLGQIIHQRYNTLRSIFISLKKLNPPIEQMQGSVGVSWYKEF